MVKRFLLIILGLAVSNFCFASTLSVLPQGQYQTIQAAVDAADAGDTILVSPGIYRENVDVYQKPRLVLKADKSNSGNATSTDVIIEAADPDKPAIKLLYANYAVIDGFILRGAATSAGIQLGYAAGEVKIRNNIIESNGDGIYIDYYGTNTNNIIGNIFRDNSKKDIYLPSQYCSQTGMDCQSSGNEIYFNDFYGNPNLYSGPYTNYWNSKEEQAYNYQNQARISKMGNYWAGGAAEDPDGDGIGGSPYRVGVSDFYDYYPLAKPFGDYEVYEPEIISGDQEWDQSRVIDKPVIVPAGSKLTVKKGITLNIQSRGAIIVDGELTVKGTVKNPVKLAGENGYSGKLVSIRNTGAADLRNVEIIASLTDGLPSRQTAVAVAGQGKLEMQACRVSGNVVGVELDQTFGANIKINRSKFFNNVVDVANNNPADTVAPDFKYNWWADAKITGTIDSSNRAAANFRDPVILVPGIVGSWPENGVLRIDPIFHSFDGLIDQLEAAGYVKGVDLFEFPYNWRNDNESTARSFYGLIQKIKTDTQMPKVDVVAHSMGGLVARQYIESVYYQNDVDQLITLATPNNGSPESYLTWEAGELKPGLFESLGRNVLLQEAEEMRYPNLFSYVRERVPSVSQLLPIYNYLYEGNNLTRFYPNGYPQNQFLENLNLAENVKKMTTVEYGKIIANLSDNQSTITGFNVVTSTQPPKWQHGYPSGYDLPVGERGMVWGAGDGTVPLVSAQSVNILADEEIIVTSDHRGAMNISRQDVMELLSGIRPQGATIDWRLPNLMLVRVFSPVDIQIVAPDGKWIGKNITNLPETNKIAGAYYTGADADAEFATIPDPSGDYKIITQGTGAGEFSVETTMISQNSENQQVQETSAIIQGVAVLNQQDQFAIAVDGGQVVVEENDIVAPLIVITSPQNNEVHSNNEFLTIDYSVSDNKSAPDKINKQVSLDGTVIAITANQIDLAFQKTGSHNLKIEAKDEVGNTGIKEVGFKVSATINSIAANVKKFAGLGLIKKPQNIVLAAQLKALQAQFDVLNKLKTDKKLPSKAKTAAVKALELVINKQIDLLIKEIQKASGKGIDVKAVDLLVDSLSYIKIKL
ncbi:MAG: alpha/beta hydrolase [Candidatus Paceibacterota bacterium]